MVEYKDMASELYGKNPQSMHFKPQAFAAAAANEQLSNMLTSVPKENPNLTPALIRNWKLMKPLDLDQLQ